MKLYFNDDAFSLKAKTELRDENNNVLFSGIYDFAFKGRIRIFDKNNNDSGYVQFKILSNNNEVSFFDKDNNKLAYIKQVNSLDELVISPNNYKVEGDVKGLCFVLKDDSKEIMSVGNNVINIVDEDNAVLCVMYAYALANSDELLLKG